MNFSDYFNIGLQNGVDGWKEEGIEGAANQAAYDLGYEFSNSRMKYVRELLEFNKPMTNTFILTLRHAQRANVLYEMVQEMNMPLCQQLSRDDLNIVFDIAYSMI